jgi:predicted nucleic acid-binding Zn ribbon protein
VQRFCTDHCRDRYQCERLWPKRKHYCGICGDEFLGRAERRYCSDRCRRIAQNRSALRGRNGSPQDQLFILQMKLEQEESETRE